MHPLTEVNIGRLQKDLLLLSELKPAGVREGGLVEDLAEDDRVFGVEAELPLAG